MLIFFFIFLKSMKTNKMEHQDYGKWVGLPFTDEMKTLIHIFYKYDTWFLWWNIHSKEHVIKSKKKSLLLISHIYYRSTCYVIKVWVIHRSWLGFANSSLRIDRLLLHHLENSFCHLSKCLLEMKGNGKAVRETLTPFLSSTKLDSLPHDIFFKEKY